MTEENKARKELDLFENKLKKVTQEFINSGKVMGILTVAINTEFETTKTGDKILTRIAVSANTTI